MRTDTKDVIILGGGLVILWLLFGKTNQGAAQPMMGAAPSIMPISPASNIGCYNSCPTSASQPTAGSQPSAGSPPTAVQVPSWFTDQLNAFSSQLASLNAAGNWEASWQLAAQRDAWIASLGMLPTQWEAYV